MRNIALLDWGPAALFYIQPREKIKVRTVWLQGGPILPPFLDATKEASGNGQDICVRYALSSFEDLNNAIKNLRNCFGFPYQEYIGYLNTLTRSHRARREHEALIDRLRRWAMFNNVDAVLWIDYSKSNQPPGSFKMGPHDSRPFSALHMEICTDVQGHTGKQDYDGDESEAEWSDAEDDHQGIHAFGAGLDAQTSGDATQMAGATRPFPLKKLGRKSTHRMVLLHLAAPTALSMSASQSMGEDHAPLSHRAETTKLAAFASEDFTSRKASAEFSPRDIKEAEKAVIRSMLQEEVVPVHGSIYSRSVAPGPGYYGIPAAPQPIAITMGRKVKTQMDMFVEKMKDLPGPGEYTPRARLVEEAPPSSRFSKAVRLVRIDEAPRKLPFISALASDCEARCLQGAPFDVISPEADNNKAGYTKPPKYTFNRARRPF